MALHVGRLQWLSARPLVWLGSISYALYVSHEMMGWAALRLLRKAGMAYWPAMALTVALALSFAWAITRFIEAPAMAALKPWARKLGTQTPPQPTPSEQLA